MPDIYATIVPIVPNRPVVEGTRTPDTLGQQTPQTDIAPHYKNTSRDTAQPTRRR
jgi:hypothetical protein